MSNVSSACAAAHALPHGNQQLGLRLALCYLVGLRSIRPSTRYSTGGRTAPQYGHRIADHQAHRARPLNLAAIASMQALTGPIG